MIVLGRVIIPVLVEFGDRDYEFGFWRFWGDTRVRLGCSEGVYLLPPALPIMLSSDVNTSLLARILVLTVDEFKLSLKHISNL